MLDAHDRVWVPRGTVGLPTSGLTLNPQGKGSMLCTRCLVQACHLAGALVLVAAPAAAFPLRQYPVERQEAAGLWLIKLSSALLGCLTLSWSDGRESEEEMKSPLGALSQLFLVAVEGSWGSICLVKPTQCRIRQLQTNPPPALSFIPSSF